MFPRVLFNFSQNSTSVNQMSFILIFPKKEWRITDLKQCLHRAEPGPGSRRAGLLVSRCLSPDPVANFLWVGEQPDWEEDWRRYRNGPQDVTTQWDPICGLSGAKTETHLYQPDWKEFTRGTRNCVGTEYSESWANWKPVRNQGS